MKLLVTVMVTFSVVVTVVVSAVTVLSVTDSQE